MQKFLAFLRIVFTRRNAMRVLFAVVLIATLWVAFCIEERWRGKRTWSAYRQAALARGVPLDLSAVVQPPIPDAENFAAIPMVQELFAAQREGKPLPTWFSALKLDPPDPKTPAFQPAMTPPLADWRDHFVREGVIPSAGPDPAADVLSAIAQVEPELAQLREAGKRPHSRFPVEWELGFSSTVPHLTPLTRASQVYQLRMYAHLVSGDSAAAYTDFSEGLRLYYALEREPVLVCGLVRINIIERLLARVRNGIAAGQWAAPELERIQADVSRLDLAADWRFALNSERAVLNHSMADMQRRSDRSLAQMVDEVGRTGAGSSSTSVPLVSLYPRGWLWLSQWKVNEYFDRCIARVDAIAGGKPFVLPSDTADDVEQIAKSGPLARLPYLLYVFFTPALNNVEKTYLHAINTVAQAQIACALERHRLSKGSFPEKLEELVPEDISKLPPDAVAQAPMHYRRIAPDRFDLWSLALNRTDESAKEEEKKSPRDQPDWVWRR